MPFARRCLFLTLILPLSVFAQPSPYAAETGRRIKSLSDSDITGYLAGRGMGLARAAELNRYPGPRHVLDLREELSLTTAQISALEEFFRTMEAEAKAAGAELVARETELDRLFAEQQASVEQVLRLTAEIGGLHGRARAAHLNAHIATTALLSPGQVTRYAELRGYDRGTGDTHTRSGH